MGLRRSRRKKRMRTQMKTTTLLKMSKGLNKEIMLIKSSHVYI